MSTQIHDVKSILTTGAALADAALERLLPAATIEPHSIHRAMRHSTFAGGKRLRPILCMEAARMVAGTLPPGAAELGAAIELVHTYSLIHDDLPALDNDDLRRGQPTCHVVFGEAVEILREFSLAIGTGVGGYLPPGMIGGQVMDIEGEGHKPTAELVERIHRAKTGALITTSIVCGGLLGLGHLLARQETPGAPHLASEMWDGRSSQNIIAQLRTFGESAGLAFQIVDDILDVTQSSEQLGKTAGKDTAADKATWPAVYGIAQSKHDAAELIADADQALAPFGDAANPLMSLARYLTDRTH